MPYASGVSSRAACTTTDASMVAIRDAIMGTGLLQGYYEDVRAFPTTLGDLFNQPAGVKPFNPVTQRGWHGPYLMNGITLTDDDWQEYRNYEDSDPSRFELPAYINHPPTPTGTPVTTVLDSWNRPIILQTPVGGKQYTRLVSAGIDKILTTTLTDNEALGRGDDRVIFLDLAELPVLSAAQKEAQTCE